MILSCFFTPLSKVTDLTLWWRVRRRIRLGPVESTLVALARRGRDRLRLVDMVRDGRMMFDMGCCPNYGWLLFGGLNLGGGDVTRLTIDNLPG